jgi:hypothetical protein
VAVRAGRRRGGRVRTQAGRAAPRERGCRGCRETGRPTPDLTRLVANLEYITVSLGQRRGEKWFLNIVIVAELEADPKE